MLLLFFVNILFRALYLVLIAYALMSWFVPYPRHAWQRWIAAAAEPLLHPIRALIPPVGGMDLSPAIAGLILMLLQQVVVQAMIP